MGADSASVPTETADRCTQQDGHPTRLVRRPLLTSRPPVNSLRPCYSVFFVTVPSGLVIVVVMVKSSLQTIVVVVPSRFLKVASVPGPPI